MSYRRKTIFRLAALAMLATLAFGFAILLPALAQRPERILYPAKATPLRGGEQGGKALPPDWRIAEGVTYENLTVFPVVAKSGADTSGYITLDEGLTSGQVVITESGYEIMRRSRDARTQTWPPPERRGPSVNRLALINRSAKPLVLLAGELVSGGKQDRVIAKDRIVPPNSEPLPLDVFCVEHGRWSAGSAFAESKIMVHPSVREQAALAQNQSQVWDAVRRGSTSDAAASAPVSPSARPALSAEGVGRVIREEAQSESYAKVYHRSRIGQSVESFAEEVQRRFDRAVAGLKSERVVGVVIAYGGEVAWSDLFASPQLFERYWRKLLRSYAVEALARPRTSEKATLEDARDFLEPLRGHITEESEPGVYRWRQIASGRYAEIELEALPKGVVIHRTKVRRTS
jgi:hypothetical protein